MKTDMKKIIFIVLFIVPFLFAGCGEKFLDSENLTEKDLGNYYSNETDISEALAAVYACLPIDNGSNHQILISNILGDDCFSGGGTNDIQTIGTDMFQFVTEDQYLPMYELSYTGIGRANSLIKAFEEGKPSFKNESDLNQAWGEAYFLRAFLYFRLAQFFGDVPLNVSLEADVLKRNPASEVYAQIASDLINAVEKLADTPYASISSNRRGHATKWAAESLMARVYLFYTGYYDQDLTTTGGETVTQSQVVTMLEDVINNSGHGLLDNYESLWPFSYTGDDPTDTLSYNYYYYGRGDTITWAGDDNKEVIFAVKYSPNGDWGNTGRLSYSNQYVLFTSVRANNYPPFGAGWGIGSVNPQLKDSYEDGDIRRQATIIDNTDPNEGRVFSEYEWGGWNCANETGLWNKKYTSIIQDLDDPSTTDVNEANDSTGYSGMFYYLYGGTNNMQLWNMQDDIIIRFADVLLMHSELTKTDVGLNLVRARVGLDPVGYSLENLKSERRHELALEGLRYYDLLRWGDAKTAIEAANGISVLTENLETSYSVSFSWDRAFVKFPESQIRLSNGRMEQTPGWGN